MDPRGVALMDAAYGNDSRLRSRTQNSPSIEEIAIKSGAQRESAKPSPEMGPVRTKASFLPLPAVYGVYVPFLARCRARTASLPSVAPNSNMLAVQLLRAMAGKGFLTVIWTGSLQIEVPRARLPDGVRIYAIGDVHGRVDLLDQVLSRIDVDLATHPTANALLVFLGDYIDRGPASKSVLDRLIACCANRPTVCLIGNHEIYMCEFLKTPEILSAWRKYGGLDTLLSYGIMPSIEDGPEEQVKLACALDRALPSSHRQFLNSLRPYFVCGDFFFVHAGVRPGISLTDQSEEDLLWIREDFLHYEDSFGKIIVHGHTPVLEPEIRANRIGIDTGAYATGRLTCLVLEGADVNFI